MQTLGRLLQLLDLLSNDLDQQIERLETFADLVESQIPIGPILATNLALDMTKWLALKRNRVWFDAHRNELGLGLFGGHFGQYFALHRLPRLVRLERYNDLQIWHSNFLRVPVQNNVSFYFALSDLIDHALTDF